MYVYCDLNLKKKTFYFIWMTVYLHTCDIINAIKISRFAFLCIVNMLLISSWIFHTSQKLPPLAFVIFARDITYIQQQDKITVSFICNVIMRCQTDKYCENFYNTLHIIEKILLNIIFDFEFHLEITISTL